MRHSNGNVQSVHSTAKSLRLLEVTQCLACPVSNSSEAYSYNSPRLYFYNSLDLRSYVADRRTFHTHNYISPAVPNLNLGSLESRKSSSSPRIFFFVYYVRLHNHTDDTEHNSPSSSPKHIFVIMFSLLALHITFSRSQ